MLDALVPQPTSSERGVLEAVRFLRGMRSRTGELIPNHQVPAVLREDLDE